MNTYVHLYDGVTFLCEICMEMKSKKRLAPETNYLLCEERAEAEETLDRNITLERDRL